MVRVSAGAIDLAVLRLGPEEPAPAWVTSAAWFSVTRTAGETSAVCPIAAAPPGTGISGPWRALSLEGPLGHELVGVLASVAVPLAEARIPVFVISTFDTDHVLVPGSQLEAALAALAAAGHQLMP